MRFANPLRLVQSTTDELAETGRSATESIGSVDSNKALQILFGDVLAGRREHNVSPSRPSDVMAHEVNRSDGNETASKDTLLFVEGKLADIIGIKDSVNRVSLEVKDVRIYVEKEVSGISQCVAEARTFIESAIEQKKSYENERNYINQKLQEALKAADSLAQNEIFVKALSETIKKNEKISEEFANLKREFVVMKRRNRAMVSKNRKLIWKMRILMFVKVPGIFTVLLIVMFLALSYVSHLGFVIPGLMG